MEFSVVTNHDTHKKTVLAFFPDESEPLVSATSDHPHFTSIVRGLEAGDETVYGLFDIQRGVNRKFEQVSSRYSVKNGKFYKDLDEVDDAMTQQILRFMDDGVDDWKPLVKFLERVDANPNPSSRESLYKWILKDKLTVTDEGMILGYKSMRKAEDGSFTSTQTGYGVVDGAEIKQGYIPNKPGSVVQMPRSMVDDNTGNACSTGLHVGTWKYASTFSGGKYVMAVEFDPADAVAVPYDDAGKIRVCRYKVIGLVDSKYDGPLYATEDYRTPAQVGADNPDTPDAW